MTFAVRLEDYPAHSVGEYPGDSVNVKYNESIFVGYRWMEKHGVKTLFPFGHGLSYTEFRYGKVALSSSEMSRDGKLTLSVPVKNVGKVKGKEVVQLYIGDEKASVERPLKELKGFRKVELFPGEEKTVEFEVTLKDLMFYDEGSHGWKAEPGKFKAYVGSSSADIRSVGTFTLL